MVTKILVNGREFVKVPLPNGASELLALDGGDISEKEWEEFCQSEVKASMAVWTQKRKIGRWD